MRRTARALSVAVLAGAALVVPGPAAYADPAAEASPRPVQPGGPASAPAACDIPTGPAPQAHEATPQALEGRTMSLRREPGAASVPGPASIPTSAPTTHSGDADCPLAPDGQGKSRSPDSVSGDAEAGGRTEGDDNSGGTGEDDGGSCAQGQRCTEGQGDGQDQGLLQDNDEDEGEGEDQGQGPDRGQEQGQGQGQEQGEGEGEGQHQGQGRECGSGRTCTDDQACADSHSGDCAPASVQQGVDAGAGGSFNDSVPALVIGGALIATACGGAVYRLYGRRRSAQG
jgi:hypothetical protein